MTMTTEPVSMSTWHEANPHPTYAGLLGRLQGAVVSFFATRDDVYLRDVADEVEAQCAAIRERNEAAMDRADVVCEARRAVIAADDDEAPF